MKMKILLQITFMRTDHYTSVYMHGNPSSDVPFLMKLHMDTMGDYLFQEVLKNTIKRREQVMIYR